MNGQNVWAAASCVVFFVAVIVYVAACVFFKVLVGVWVGVDVDVDVNDNVVNLNININVGLFDVIFNVGLAANVANY